jgi:rhodanese-related sulfurtransferase
MVQTITAEELKAIIDNKEDFRLIEALLPEAYNKWHIPTAENIPAGVTREIAPEKLKKNEEIIVYCASLECKASTRAANALIELGYKKVIDFEGGKKEWKSKGYSLEK